MVVDTTTTTEIIYHLQLPGLQEEGGLDNAEAPTVQGAPCLNIILHQFRLQATAKARGGSVSSPLGDMTPSQGAHRS